ncbi:unnamed protein product, partial [Brachionus calyciflorus]
MRRECRINLNKVDEKLTSQVTTKAENNSIGHEKSLPRVDIKFGFDGTGIILKTLIDCGSSSSFINAEKLPLKIKKSLSEFIDSNGTSKNIYNFELICVRLSGSFFKNGEVKGVQCDLNLEIGKWKGIHKFIIVNNMQDEMAILGFDFLKRYKWNFDPKTEELAIFDESGPVFCVTAADELIPPRTEKILTVALNNIQLTPGVVVFEPMFLEKEGLGIAASIDKLTGNEIKINVVNVSDEPILLKKDEVIGQIEHPSQVLDTKFVVDSSDRLDKLAEALDKHIGSNLSFENNDKLRNLIMRFSDVISLNDLDLDVISLNDLDLGSTDLTTHRINLKTETPIKSSPYKTNHVMRRELETQIKKMSDANVIEESDSPFASPVVLVRKKDGTYRFCIDFRKLNEQTIKDAYPIPRIDEVIEPVFDAKIFTIIDLIQGYWQVEIDEQDKHKTAFITTSGLYHFNKMPFGLCNAPATFQRLMNKVLTGILWKRCIVYLDDIIIYAKTFSDHLEALEEVFKRLSRAGLKIKLSKYHFITNTVRYLGFLITADGLKADPSKVSAILNVEVPKNVKDVRAFLGMASYYRRFMPNFSHIAEPLTNLTHKKITFKWTQECDISFNEIKKLLTKAPVLKLPDVDKPFILQCDASGKALGAVLAQINADGYVQPIAYASRALTETEQKYTTTEREGLVIVWALTYFKYLICDQPVDVCTDHRPLAFMRSVQEPYGRIGRF